MTAAIKVSNLSKRYLIGLQRQRYKTLGESLSGLLHRRGDAEKKIFWALRDVGFEVAHGEAVGVIGRNGAGKSTLLKILSRITEPTTGRIELNGRIGSLLEVGTGFHPELTGRENIFLNGAILGMKRAEIRARFDEIVDFAGVDRFIDTPVKRYSSGMYVRLAFAVAAHLEPDILLVDEVLAVGDMQFQKKCLGKMNDIARSEGRTILFVSHNMAAIEALCPRTLLVERGQISAMGDTETIIGKYMTDGVEDSYDVDLSGHPNRVLGFAPILRRLRLTDSEGRVVKGVPLGADVCFEVELASGCDYDDIAVGIHIYNMLGQRVMTCHSAYQHPDTIALRGALKLLCRVKRFALLPGSYSVVLGVAGNRDQVDRIDPAFSFEVCPRDVYKTGRLPPPHDGVFVPEAEWATA